MEENTMNTKKITLAIVEDTPETMARFVNAIVKRPNDFELLYTTDSGVHMSDWLKDNKPDVLLVDLGLPDISGLEVIIQCRENSPKTDILVITLFGDEIHMIAAFKAGATGYLLKDGNELDLVANIFDIHSGGSPMSPLIARQLLKHLSIEGAAVKAPVADLAQKASLLTLKEKTILQHLSQGFSYQESAALSSISVGTVCSHIKNIYRKLEVHSKTEAIFEARQIGILAH
jgi:DNA-binding NarL/FixJ family response regulator